MFLIVVRDDSPNIIELHVSERDRPDVPPPWHAEVPFLDFDDGPDGPPLYDDPFAVPSLDNLPPRDPDDPLFYIDDPDDIA
jgi:hypothetical protein